MFCSVVPPAISLARCWNDATTVSKSCRFYTLIPGKHKHFSKSPSWLGRKTEIAFYQNEKDFFMGSSKSSLKAGRHFYLRKGFFRMADRKAGLLPCPEISLTHGASYVQLMLRVTRSGKTPRPLVRVWGQCPSCLTVLKPMAWVLRVLFYFFPRP